MKRSLPAAAVAVPFLLFQFSGPVVVLAQNGVPRPDHVVIVIEENKSFGMIIGSASAPYINSLAEQGALFISSFALSHPSQPNYLGLFSGSTHGIGDDSCPHHLSGPNLASELFDAGFTFTGYSESMPAPGYRGCETGNYARKHNPWVNFNNVPASANLTMASFPTNFDELPTIAIVVPNLVNDMHDGPSRSGKIARGDAWLRDHLDPYIQWAKVNNSLFLLTWDEGADGSDNRIVTLMAGQMVRPGRYAEHINHFNTLRTLLEMYGLPAMARSTNADPITSPWTPESANSPISVEITNPTDGITLLAPATITLRADASSAGSEIARVEFFDRAVKLGEATNSPFTLTWTNVPAGDHWLVAKATDALGRRKTSTSVAVLVIEPDVTPPSIAVTNPPAGARLTNDAVTLQGTASDNLRVAEVRLTLGDVTVSTTNVNPWSLTLSNVPPGTNTVLIEAVDTFSNRTQVARSFFRRVLAPLGLNISGNFAAGIVPGTITGPANGQLLEIGQVYALMAKPSPNYLFGGWAAPDLIARDLTLRFQMASNTAYTAIFNTNLFPAVKGTYTGLFYDVNDVEEQSSGFITVTVGDLGSYSAKLIIQGKTYPMAGTFDSGTGQSTNLLSRPTRNPLALALTLDLTNGTDQLTGTVSEETAGSNDWTAQLTADRAVFSAATNPAPQAGKYTMIVPVDADSAFGPGGDGFGTVTVTTAGAVSFSGLLADGTRVTQRTGLSKDGRWPLFAALYRGKGSLFSWITFADETNSDFHGLFNWFKQTQTAKYYPGGFTNEAVLVGSHFMLPAATNRVLDITNGVVAFTNGNAISGFTNLVVLDANGKVTNQGTNKMSLNISRSSGTFSGSVTPAAGGKTISFKGALLQKQNLGSGFFPATNGSGRVSLRAQ